MRWNRPTVAFSAMLIAMVLFAVPALPAELRLTIKDVHSDQGELLIGLYDNAEGFRHAIENAATRGLLPDSGRLIGTAIRAQHGIQSTVFTQLAAGRYAIIVIHDENDNGRLDKDALGVPTEGYGFGNDARSLFSAPSFDAAAITVAETSVEATITLRYPRAPSAQDDVDYKRFLGSGSSKQSDH